MMRALTFLTVLFALMVPALAQVTIGEHVPANFSTSHPYEKSGSPEPVLTKTDVITFPKATYIAIHFARFSLAPDDFVVVKSPDEEQLWVYRGLGRANLGLSDEGFFATHLKGDMAIIELWTQGDETAFGYEIDYYGRGYNQEEIRAFWDAGLGEEMNLPELPEESRSVCTTDDTREVKCYQTSDPDAYDKARAVARLFKSGSIHCTGWLIGNEGHFMTNEHCIASQSELNTIDFEFMAEGPDCSTNCASGAACPGVIEASGGTLVAVDSALDYSLVIPDTSTANNTDLPATYGYMQLRESGAVLGERLYIAQHPAGWGKRLAMESSYPDDADGWAHVVSITETPCSGGTYDVGYWADTQGGSSGSPVLGYSDNKVIALHHCRGSAYCTSGNPTSDDPNRGVPIQDVITDLGPDLPPSAVCPTIAIPTGLTAGNNGDNQVDLSWDSAGAGLEYLILRSLGSCPGTNFEVIAGPLDQTTYSDTTVSADVLYSYAVVSLNADGCESDPSNCQEVTPTGTCNLIPAFAGLEGAANAQTQDCMIHLTWSAAVPYCGTPVTYNLYRNEDPGFVPGPANMIASCVSQTEYMDYDVLTGVDYTYVVRAEDNSGIGSGPCASGYEDDNSLTVTAMPTGPDAISFEDDMESGTGNWTPTPGAGTPGQTDPFVLVDTVSHSPSHAWFCPSLDDPKDQMLVTSSAIALPASPGLRLSFFHVVSMEPNYDGCVLEYSIDSTNWHDILEGDDGAIPANPDRFLANGYNVTLNSSTSNPLSQRFAWNGDIGTVDVFVQVLIDLDDFSGQNVWFRWRLGCDSIISRTGWWIDDVRTYYSTDCTSEPPEYSMLLWRSPQDYHPFYDMDGDGSISVLDMVYHLNSQP